MSPEVYRSTVPKFTLDIEKEGYKPIKEDLFLMQAMTVKDYAFESIGRNLAVSSVPKGAKVFVDGKDSGKLTDCELPFVPYGNHTIKLVRDNYAEWEGPVQIAEGTDPVSLAATLAVNTYVFGPKERRAGAQFLQAAPGDRLRQGRQLLYRRRERRTGSRNSTAEARFQASWGDAGRESRVLKVPAGIAVDARGQRLCHGFQGLLRR